jgi:hypothetical protein
LTRIFTLNKKNIIIILHLWLLFDLSLRLSVIYFTDKSSKKSYTVRYTTIN